MLIERGFYDEQINDRGRPPYLDFGGLKPLQDGLLVQDVSTRRIWMRDCHEPDVDGSDAFGTVKAAQTFKARMNDERLGGFSEWRIPTIEEAMSLMTPHVRKGGLHISELFADHAYVATCDGFIPTASGMPPMSWYACYGPGVCQAAPSSLPAAIRLVRTELTSAFEKSPSNP